MGGRVIDAEVKQIIDVDFDTAPFINAANVMVNNTLDGEGLTAETLKEIERWVAAHFVAVRSPRLKSQKAGDAKEDYEQAKTGRGLNATAYGQQALALDTTGLLADMGLKPAGVTAIELGWEDD